MSEWDDLRKAGATAIEILATTTATATATGFPDVAEASDDVQYVISTDFQAAESIEQIPQRSYVALEARVKILEDQITKGEGPSTEVFKCREDFEDCMRKAEGTRQQVICWLTFTACLGERFTTFVER